MRLRASIAVFIPLACGAAGITLLYLGMRSVMEIGGACAEGGPFVPVRPCPKGVPVLMIGGIWGGIISLGIYVWKSMKYQVPSLIMLAWPALFLSLGWNFLEYGLNPPFGGGLEWGWLVCAFVFGLMGGLPLLAFLKPLSEKFRGSPIPMPQPGATKGPAWNQTAGSLLTQLQTLSKTAKKVAATSAPDSDELIDALERLEALHRSGSLSESEFQIAKRKILGGGQ
jgi:hypothetical protein